MTAQKIINIEQYCTEINILELLQPSPVFNLLVAPTGSGKTTALMKLAESHDYNLAFVSPFTSINEQVAVEYPNFSIKTGMKAQDTVSQGRHTITTMHSIPRLLELEHIDILVIDEIHQLVNYAGYAAGILQPLWDTIQTLMVKHPSMKIIAATGTPQFIRLYSYFQFQEIIVKPKKMLLDKIEEIVISRSLKNEYTKDSYICLYPSRKQGLAQAMKHNGDFVESANKETSQAYINIITEGKLNKPRLFTSTLLATGVSITDDIDKAIVNWSDIIDAVQFVSRLRNGCKKACFTCTDFWHEKDGVEPVLLSFSGDFMQDMKLLGRYQAYISWLVRQDEDLYNTIIKTMLSSPETDIIDIIYNW